MDVEDIRTVVQLAGLAPSVHNTQPWRFRWDGSTLTVLEDVSRALPVLDPSGRERVLSCGAAVLHARLAFAELGAATTTTLLPAPGEVARITVTGRREPTEAERELVRAIPHRTTDRDPYADRPLPPELEAALARAAAEEGAWTHAVRTEDERVDLAVLLSAADAGQRSDPDYLAELALWRREAAPDGVPRRALPTVPEGARASEVVLRDFDAASAGAVAADRTGVPSADDGPPPAEHPYLLLVGTDGDTPRDWLVAGQATARLLLRAAVDSVAAQPLTAVLEEPYQRTRLRAELHLVGSPQMLVRLGYGTAGPRSPRRPVDDVLEVVGG